MVTNSNSVAAYYSEVSYGQQALNVTVACLTPSTGCTANTYSGGWLKGLDPTTQATHRDTGQLRLQLDPPGRRHCGDQRGTSTSRAISNRYYVFPYLSACGWAGLAYVGYGEAYSNGYNTLGVYGHELGHNFGLLHAGSLRCAGQMPCTGGSVAEYGDPFDIMGNTNTGGSHFNAKQKSDILQWIPATAIKTHTTRNGDLYVVTDRIGRRRDLRDQDPGGKQSNLLGRISPADRVRQRAIRLSEQRRSDSGSEPVRVVRRCG